MVIGARRHLDPVIIVIGPGVGVRIVPSGVPRPKEPCDYVHPAGRTGRSVPGWSGWCIDSRQRW
jgi:hypothetical protein